MFLREVLLTRLGFSPNYEEYGNGGEGSYDWGGWAQDVIGSVIQGTTGGGGGVVMTNPVNCPADPKFQEQHGQEFYARARQYGVPAIGLWYGNMVQVDPNGACKRIGSIGGPGGQATYDLAKQFLANLGTTMAFWATRQPEGGWLFYAPPNYVGSNPPPGFQAPGPVPSPTASSQLPIPQIGPGPVYQPGTSPLFPWSGMSAMGGSDMTSLLMLGGLALYLLTRKK
jgi:hypothetical protein